jgi:hypothetical protein
MKALTLVFAFALFAWVLYSCNSGKSPDQTTNAQPSKDSLIKRGNYLVATLGCNDCHSPKKMGPQGPLVDSLRMLSGFPSNSPVPATNVSDIKNGLILFNDDLTFTVGPWGTTFAANITSDETGIGNWKEEQFKNALRNGKYKGLDGERMLMPPMPWPDFRNLTDADMQAIFYYLKSTKPVKNIVPAFRPAGKG